MSKDKYHHGNLKKELINKGLYLLNQDGYESFSFRKVAVMCGVSHAAPYKHFENKDQLIAEITQEVANSFRASLEEVLIRYPDDPKLQIIEMGKAYVRYMVENPEYLKFIFLSSFNHIKSVKLTNNNFFYEEKTAFGVFYQSATNYLKTLQISRDNWTLDILTMWSLVHGIAVLITNHSIEYDGDYLELVEQMLQEKLTIFIENC